MQGADEVFNEWFTKVKQTLERGIADRMFQENVNIRLKTQKAMNTTGLHMTDVMFTEG